MTNHSPNTEQRERAEFEAWLGKPMMNPAQPSHYNGRDVRLAWEAWQAARATQAAPASPNTGAAPDPRLEDLRYIVERLARKVAKLDPDSGEATGALIYLRRVGLTGSPLRTTPSPSKGGEAEEVIDSEAVFKSTTESFNRGWKAGWAACLKGGEAGAAEDNSGKEEK